MSSQFKLLNSRRFGPLFFTQFLGAFNDNLFKTCVAVIIAYSLWDIGDWRPEVLVSIAAGIFMLPFVLLTPLAGDLADKYNKAVMIRCTKIAEIVIICLAIAGLAMQSVPLVLFVTFLLGAQSAFFTPCKFSILPDHLSRQELIGGNALVSTGTYLAILLGTILASLFAVTESGVALIASILFLAAIAGYLISLMIPTAMPANPNIKPRLNTLAQAFSKIRYAARQPQKIFAAMVGVAWFYFVAATILAQFPNFAKVTLGADNIVLTFFMVIFSIGIAAGGLINNHLLKAKIRAHIVPLAVLAISVFSCDLYLVSQNYAGSAAHIPGDMVPLLSLAAFLADFSGWRITLDLFFLSFLGGLFVVPLRALVQHHAPKEQCARIIAAGNMMEAVFMLASAVLSAILLSAGLQVADLFLLLAVVNLGMVLYLAQFLEAKTLRRFLSRMRNKQRSKKLNKEPKR